MNVLQQNLNSLNQVWQNVSNSRIWHHWEFDLYTTLSKIQGQAQLNSDF